MRHEIQQNLALELSRLVDVSCPDMRDRRGDVVRCHYGDLSYRVVEKGGGGFEWSPEDWHSPR